MTQIQYDSPVRYPNGWVRTPLSQRSFNNNFSHTLTLNESILSLEEEVSATGASVGVIYTAYEHLRNERLRRMIGSDTAASVMLKHEGKGVVLACDKWKLTEHNIYALHLSLRALRHLEEWGVMPFAHLLAAMGERDEEAARPAGLTGENADITEWMRQLGLGPTATLGDANAVYRRRIKEAVDDEHQMLDLNRAIEEARKVLRD